MAIKIKNNAMTTLAEDIDAVVTVFDVVDGSKLPVLENSDYCYLTIANAAKNEIVKVTDITGNTITCERAQDDTVATDFLAGDKAEIRVTVAMINDLLNPEEGLPTTEVVSGNATGDGITDTFTLLDGSDPVIPSSVHMVFWEEDGVLQKPGTDFTLSGNELTRTSIPVDGADIAWYVITSINSTAAADALTALTTAEATMATQVSEATTAATVATTQADIATDKANEVTALFAQINKPLNTRISGGDYQILNTDAGSAFEMVDGSGLILPEADDNLKPNVDEPFQVWVDVHADFNCTLSTTDGATIEGAVSPYVITPGSSVLVRLDEYIENEIKHYNWNLQVFGSGTGEFIPVGSIQPFAMNTVPTGYLECNGAAVSRDVYADLFSAIGTTYGVGDGSTTFNLPVRDDVSSYNIEETNTRTEGTLVGNMTGNDGLGAAFNGVVEIYNDSAYNRSVGSTAYIGKQFTAAKTIVSAVCNSPSDRGFTFNTTGDVTLTLRGSNTAASYGGGVILATSTFADTVGNAVTLTPSEPTPYEYVWVDILVTSGSDIYMSELVLNEDVVTYFTDDLVYGIKAFNATVNSANVDLTTLAGEIRASNPVGAVVPFGQDTTPSGWLACDGSIVSRDTYAALYAAIGDKYGAGDGATTFNLPEQADIYPDFYKEGAAISGAEGTLLGNMTSGGGLPALFDGSNSTTANAGWQTSEQQGFAGKDFGSVKRIWSAIVVPDSTYGFFTNESSPPTPVVTVQIRGSNAAPSSQTDGVLLGSYSSEDSTATVNVQCDASLGAYRYVWAAFESSNTATLTTTAEITFVEAKEVSLPTLTCIKAYDVVQEAAGPTTQDLVTAVEGSRLRVGARMTFESDPGAGWLLEDGSVYNISTYPDLGGLLLNTYGGDGVTTFAVRNSNLIGQIGQYDGSVFGNMTSYGGLVAAFDGNVDQAHTEGANEDTTTVGYGFVGKSFSKPKTLTKATVYGSNNYGYWYHGSTGELRLRGSNDTPVFGEGDLLSTVTIGTDANSLATDLFVTAPKPYLHYWIESQSTYGTSELTYVAEVQFFERQDPTYIKAYDVINETAGVSTSDIMTEVNEMKASKQDMVQLLHMTHDEPSGVVGSVHFPNAVGGNRRKLNTLHMNTIDGATVDLTNGRATIPAGTYKCSIEAFAYQCQTAFSALVSVTGNLLVRGMNIYAQSSNNVDGPGTTAFGVFTVTEPTMIQVNTYVDSITSTTWGLGSTYSGGLDERYVNLLLEKIA